MEVVDALPGWVREFRAQPELATRSLPVRWAVVVDGALPAGLVTNAVACVGAAVAALVPAVVGEGATDASGTAHPGLPWLGCTILRGDSATVHAVRSKALGDPAVLVADMPAVAQQVRVYADYLAQVRDATEERLAYYAVSLLGPRKAIDRLVGSLPPAAMNRADDARVLTHSPTWRPDGAGPAAGPWTSARLLRPPR